MPQIPFNLWLDIDVLGPGIICLLGASTILLDFYQNRGLALLLFAFWLADGAQLRFGDELTELGNGFGSLVWRLLAFLGALDGRGLDILGRDLPSARLLDQLYILVIRSCNLSFICFRNIYATPRELVFRYWFKFSTDLLQSSICLLLFSSWCSEMVSRNVI